MQLQLELFKLVPALNGRRLTLGKLRIKSKVRQVLCTNINYSETYHGVEIFHLSVTLADILENGSRIVVIGLPRQFDRLAAVLVIAFALIIAVIGDTGLSCNLAINRDLLLLSIH